MKICQTKSLPVPNKLPRFSLKHPDLIIRDNSREFCYRGLNQKDFENWHSTCHPSVPFSGADHKTAHELRCRFIFDFYIEFTDRQYLKNTGYRRSGKEDWFDVYAEYLQTQHVGYDSRLEKVVLENKQFGFVTNLVRDPVQDEDLEIYAADANEYFLPHIKEKFPFEPDWGHWWKSHFSSPEILEIDLNRHFEVWSHPNTPELDWIKTKKDQFFRDLDQEWSKRQLWVQHIDRFWNLHRDFYWDFVSIPAESPFKETSLRKSGYYADCESKVHFFLNRKVNWPKTIERINKRANKARQKAEKLATESRDERSVRQKV